MSALAAFRRNFVTGEGLTARGAVRAVAEGVPGVPTVTVGGKHFWGDDRLEEASGVSDEPR
jgi:2-hydroxychromene-2-carboxylate isomerase